MRISESSERSIRFIDTDIVDACAVDIEVPSRGAMVVSTLSHIQTFGGLLEFFLPRIVELAASNRYDRLVAFVCVDVELDSTAARDIVRLQTAFLSCETGMPKTHTSIQLSSKPSLAASIVQTVSLLTKSLGDIPSFDPSNTGHWLSDPKTCQRLKFLISIIPTLSAIGALHLMNICIGSLESNRISSHSSVQDPATEEWNDKLSGWFQQCFSNVDEVSNLLESYLLWPNSDVSSSNREDYSSISQSVPKQLVTVVRTRLNQK